MGTAGPPKTRRQWSPLIWNNHLANSELSEKIAILKKKLLEVEGLVISYEITIYPIRYVVMGGIVVRQSA